MTVNLYKSGNSDTHIDMKRSKFSARAVSSGCAACALCSMQRKTVVAPCKPFEIMVS